MTCPVINSLTCRLLLNFSQLKSLKSEEQTIMLFPCNRPIRQNSKLDFPRGCSWKLSWFTLWNVTKLQVYKHGSNIMNLRLEMSLKTLVSDWFICGLVWISTNQMLEIETGPQFQCNDPKPRTVFTKYLQLFHFQ